MQITLEQLVRLVIEYNESLEDGEAVMTVKEMAEIMECEVMIDG